MTNFLYSGDLPNDLDLGSVVAVDCETMGLNTQRDRLCLVQISSGDGHAHLVQFSPASYDAPRLRALLSDPKVLKLYHFARFDLAAIMHWLQVSATPVYCTKVASRLTRTFTDRHGLKDLTRDLLGIEISKQQQSSDWGAGALSAAQVDYAAADVLYLHAIREKLDLMLAREGRAPLAEACFRFLPARAALDLAGWAEIDILAHV